VHVGLQLIRILGGAGIFILRNHSPAFLEIS